MALNKLCKCTTALYLSVLIGAWLILPATYVEIKSEKTLCAEVRNHTSCVHCFRQKAKRDPFPMAFVFPETPYAFLASFASCKEFTCEDMLQGIDNAKEDLSIQITKEFNDYLNELNTTIIVVEGKPAPLKLDDHAWALFTRQMNKKPYILYRLAQAGMYEAIVETILLFISLLILVWDSRKKNQGAAASSSAKSTPVVILGCLFFVELIPLLPLQNLIKFWMYLTWYSVCFLWILYRNLTYIEGTQSSVIWVTTILIALIENAKQDHRSLGYSRMLCFGLLLPILTIIFKTFQINRQKTPQELVSSIGSCLMLLALLAAKMTDQKIWSLATITLLNSVPVLLTIDISQEGFSKIQGEVDMVEEELQESDLN